MPTVKGEQLTQIAFHLFCAAGAPEDHSRVVAEHLADNNLAGHDSHGFIRVIQYIRQIKDGLLIPSAKPEIVRESPSTAQVDGHYGFGQVAARFSTELAIAKAKKSGVSSVTVRHLGHLGRLGAYGEMAARQGCAAILFCSTGGHALSQAPFGGSKRRLGTNPIALAFPGEKQGVISSDFATSVAAEGKVRVYRARGHKLPDGWILDKDGHPSNDPNDFYAGGPLLPIGASVGYKGFCLAFMTDIFGSLLSRDGFPASPGKQFSNGSLITVIDIERFAPLDAAKSEASRMVDFVKDTPRVTGFERILYPGEKETMSRRERTQSGVQIEEETWSQVSELLREYRVADKIGNLPQG
jgi:LDH2 family malate/lactate/ureidoglycolate dehydrogenase